MISLVEGAKQIYLKIVMHTLYTVSELLSLKGDAFPLTHISYVSLMHKP